MKYVYIFLVVLLAYGVVSVLYFLYKKSHLAELPVIQQTEQTHGTGPVLRYVAAGDSTAVGQGASEVSTTYPYQVYDFLTRTHTVTYKNVAVSGAKTQDVIDTQLQQVLDFKPDVVTLSIGANDTTHLWSRAQTLQNIQTIIEAVRTRTAATIYVATIPNFKGGTLLPWYYIALLEYRSAWLNAQLKELESDRVHIVNVHDHLMPEHSVRSETFAADGFHPNDAGYANWASAFTNAISK